MTKKTTVLVDLGLAHKTNGYSVIPQDARMLFSSLIYSSNLDITGWITGQRMGGASKKMDCLLTQAVFLGCELYGIEGIPAVFSRYKRIFKIYRVLRALGGAFKSRFKSYSLHKGVDFGVIWRSFFQGTLPFSEFQRLSQAKYSLTDLSAHRILIGGFPVRVDSRGYDFILFQDVRNVRLSPGTISLIRYHDGTPVLHSDALISSSSSYRHYKAVKKCEKKAIFICNSPSAQEDLKKISSVAAERSRVIPYVLPSVHRKDVKYSNFVGILRSYISPSTLGSLSEDFVLDMWLKDCSSQERIPDFIMTLSTIEPKNNHRGLFESWQKLRLSTGKDIKLLVVGSPGWRSEPILKMMKPFIACGSLIHLEKVSHLDISSLYSSAQCFVYPAYVEGFGLPSCEAMQCGCPVAVSDIKALRYSCGEGALYFSPYNTDQMASVLGALTVSKDVQENQIQMIQKGLKNVERFEKKKVLSQWEALFNELSSK